MTDPADAATTHARRGLLRAALERLDAHYRRRLDLAPVGPLLYLGFERHTGPACALADGTCIEPGAWVGRLHFNNARAAAVEADTRPQAGIRFARLLRDSFAELAERARHEARLRPVQLFEGVTWLRVHGRGVGFEAQPLPRGLQHWLMSAHFRVLIWAFAPDVTRTGRSDVQPHRFRITRRALLASFGSPRPTARARVERAQTGPP